nr:GIY-YIG nuclease family protein [Allomuricauda sp.]
MNKSKSRKRGRSQINYQSSNNNHSYIYVTGSNSKSDSEETPVKSIHPSDCQVRFEWKRNDTFPTFLSDHNTISIPIGIKRHLERLPNNILNKIDADRTVAIEKCLIAASNLTSSLFIEDEEWKPLSSKVLHNQLKKGKDNTYVYKHVLKALTYSTDSTNPVIECKQNDDGRETYQVDEISKQYKFNSTLQGKKIVQYELQCEDCINKRRVFFYEKLKEAMNNDIGHNLLSLYPQIEVPSTEEILKKGKDLVSKGYKTNKGKILTLLNKRPKKGLKDLQNRSFVEDNLRLFNYLTKRGFMIPKIGDDKSGGRVVDSFNLMPSWIRKMCKITNEENVELDYSTLHPNISLSIFGGKQKFLTHQMVAERLNMNKQEVKIEHLSFFNKHPNDMKKSQLFHYYQKHESKMLDRIIMHKKIRGYKDISRLLFKKEVEIMTESIRRLNKKGIYVMYVYDALYCKKSDVEIVKTIMNETILKHNVYTTIKSSVKYDLNENFGIVYKAENMENGMVYIGSTTKSIEERRKDHIQKAYKGVGSSFQEAIATYGLDTFKWESIDTASTIEELALKEKANIKSYDSIKSGYNKDSGGGFKKTIYQFTSWGWCVGKWNSLNWATFAVFGKEKGISNACLGYNKSYKGYYWSYEKNYIPDRDARKKQVFQYDLKGNLIEEYTSVSDASSNSGLSKTSISRACRGERSQAGGYIWKY